MTILGLDVYVWLIILGGVGAGLGAVLGLLWHYVVQPGVVNALSGKVSAEMTATHNESLSGLNSVNERLTNSEARYDAELNDLRERLNRAKI